MVPGAGALALAVFLAGCGAGPSVVRSSARALPSTAPTTAPTATSSTTTSSTTTSVPVPSFSSSVSPVTAEQLGATWHAGCPVDPSQLRMLQLSYWGFDSQPHVGKIVVNASVADQIVETFSALYAARFPIYEMVPVDVYGGDDNAAAAADDTSGFNCRDAVAPGPPQWSMHAYGEAIDVNDVQNPYVAGATIIPAAGAAYVDRSNVRPGMAEAGGPLVDAFTAIGWGWGGNWSGIVDYQHFSTNGH